MAGVAGDVFFAVRKLAVDIAGHLDHVACDVLVLQFVAGAVLHMAETALHTQRHGVITHDPHQALGLQNLQVLGAALRRRGADRNQTQHG